ncbi:MULTISPECIES: alpha/beta hydrolase [unclassified Chelatococcus]|uniref:alpha/beta fold hydrolase n=1 Tax=unclassified Chelatococcus TaxID=2638111 RepID=UPI001BD167F2|nr:MULTISPECIES: alpha/beta hydrolase [unclassified Chelatococcus]MBS7743460.1 alpha/beta hydrolase [Chelatococcus sp. HY11]MBX3547100.1 alpha/beta hydrolase [Chelatococcus sp.]CAH1663677.1 Pimeloyl-ACP methyl ester carboxylesterase [Hyphomicrobiales bacterium]CAH1687828.1 Pimeloyl-ACP methyl ester carboxylesterase [Hyphomicrobiales bacterium]
MSSPNHAMPTRQRRFELPNGLILVGKEVGDPSASLVLLFHGGAQNHRAWERSLQSLARSGYRAIAVDMRGHGDSGWAPDGRYGIEDWGADTVCLVEQLSRESNKKIALVGASRGGLGALLTAASHPDLVSCLVMIDVAPRIDESGMGAIRAFMQRSAEGFATVEDAAAALTKFMNRSPRGDASGLQAIMRRAENGLLFWTWDPRMAASEFVRPPSEAVLSIEAARRLTVSTLVVRGGNSELMRDCDVDHFRSITPHLESVTVPGIGHMLTGDSNDAFMPSVLDFLRRRHPAIAAALP